MTELWDRRIPPAEDCVLAALLERRARETPDKVFVVFEDDETWTYAQTLRHVRQAALGLQQLGVRQGDIVLSWLPTGRDCLKVWFAINYLGAVYAPINLAYRGRDPRTRDRQYAVALHRGASPARRTPRRYRSRRADRCAGDRRRAREDSRPRHARPSCPLSRFGRPAAAAPADRALGHPVDDLHLGTTGPSKGVLSSYVQMYSAARRTVPTSGRTTAISSICRCSMSAAPAASWSPHADARRLLAVVEFVRHRVVLADRSAHRMHDRDLARRDGHFCHEAAAIGRRTATIRCAPCMMVPLVEDCAAFCKRFGCDVYTVFNMTEISCRSSRGATRRRSAPAAGRATASRCGSSTRTTARCRPARLAS